MNILLMTAALAVGQTGQPPNIPADRPATNINGDWVVVEMSRNGQTIPGPGVATVTIRGDVLTFTGAGVQYPNLRLDFGPSYTLRASTTLETAVPPAQVNTTPPPTPPPPVAPGTTIGRTTVGPTQPPANALPGSVTPVPTKPPIGNGVNTGATTGRTGAGAGSGGVGGTAPGGLGPTAPGREAAAGATNAAMTGRRTDLLVPSTMSGVYVLTQDYLVLAIGTATGNPRAGSGTSGGTGGTGAVTSTGGTPRATPNSGGPPSLVLILRRAPAVPPPVIPGPRP